MGNDRVLGLAKFGQRQHVEEFVGEGRLYMKPLSYFIDLERNGPKADRDEGTTYCWQSEHATLSVEVNGELKAVPGIVGPIRYRDDTTRRANVFCMYAFRANHKSPLVDTRNLVFGDTFVVLTEGDEFLRRVELAAQKTDHRLDWKLVEYVDRSGYEGPMGIFTKFSDFSYQSEFRIALLTGTGSPTTLKIGDISDITVIGKLSEINEVLSVR